MSQGNSNHFIILGAGRGVRGSMPSAVAELGEGSRVMDWLLAAFEPSQTDQVFFVGGYKADEVIERYPNLQLVLNRDWTRTGAAHSLALAPLASGHDTYVCYADVVFRPSAVAGLREADGDIVLGVDTGWRDRYDGRAQRDLDRAEKIRLDRDRVLAIGTAVDTSAANAEFTGLMRLSPRGTAAVIDALDSGTLAPSATLPDLIDLLLRTGLDAHAVDLEADWAELDAKQDLARFVLGTKAESLERLRAMDHGGNVGALVSFTVAEWRTAPAAILERVLTSIEGRRFIVRSSTMAEDSWHESAAGQFESILDVPRTEADLTRAIEEVVGSYPEGDDHQVLVQAMLEDVAVSGVIMTRTHAIGAPYYVLNFDDTTSRTDTVTAGGDSRTIFVHHGATDAAPVSPQLKAALATVQNLEKLVGHDSLDVEFAVTKDEQVHVLQVRPIVTAGAPQPIDDREVDAALSDAQRFLLAHDVPRPAVVGGSTRYSVMSDWNPAEIIGTKPKRLAFSLYRHLVTDEVWAQQRAEYGYRDVRPCQLLVDVCGHPYVDVRATFNSFVPASLDDELARALVEHYLDLLAAEPSLHDKVEFDILFTCLSVDFDEQAAARLPRSTFTSEQVRQLRESLTTITIDGFARVDGDLGKLPQLDQRRREIVTSGLPPLEQAYLLLEATRLVGTPAFSHLARNAFVATTLLRSLVAVGALDQGAIDGYLGSIETVLGKMRTDGERVRNGQLSWPEFVDEYGHLRPGTYDITSPCYRSAAEQYLRPVVDQVAPLETGDPVTWNPSQRSAIGDALARVGLPDDVDDFDRFVRRSIAGREYGKFIFTRSLSDAIEALATFGEGLGLERAELAHLNLYDLMACRGAMGNRRALLRDRILEGVEAHTITQGICLPGQISAAADLVCFEQHAAEPNYVSQRSIQAAVIVEADLHPDADVRGRIVVIPNADPGFDWLLARDIGGLVTMYGGANSHMAVRAAELGLPAAIGVGELLYGEIMTADVLHLDCASRSIRIVR